MPGLHHHPGGMADNQQQVRRQPAVPGSPPGGTGVPRLFGLVMLAEAATLGVASYLHHDGHIPLGFTVIHGEQYASASVPEAVIGAVLAVGAVIAATVPALALRASIFATGFGIFGFLIGTVFVLTSGRPSVTIDLTYHAILLTVLIATLVMLALGRPRTAFGHSAGRQRVRSR
jgi:hypothetical protein